MEDVSEEQSENEKLLLENLRERSEFYEKDFRLIIISYKIKDTQYQAKCKLVDIQKPENRVQKEKIMTTIGNYEESVKDAKDKACEKMLHLLIPGESSEHKFEPEAGKINGTTKS